MDLVFITGNQNKADYLVRLLGTPIDHQKVDLDEIQSLDIRAITEHKVRQAYDLVKKPVLVEDVGLVIKSLGRLPGPFVKWFIEDIGLAGICRLADVSPDRGAIANCCYAYFDGDELKIFYSELEGKIADQPRGDEGFGWNPIFIPEGQSLTMGEMSEEQFSEQYLRVKPIRQVGEYLNLKTKA
jgi:non-canonical purine NTP pyrophosphatase (RdgB/HAM1 family)